VENENKIIVLDLETTSIKPYDGCIVEIGACFLDLSNGLIEKICDTIVREENFGEKDRNAWIFKNTTLKYEEVLKAPSFDSVMLHLKPILESHKFISFNVSFDSGWLESRGIKLNKMPCPMIKATNILKINSKNHGYKFPNFDEFWKYYVGTEQYKEIHRAYDDANHEAYAIYKMIKKGDYKI
jgi:DNA polymerase III epsilon subunit-like protein